VSRGTELGGRQPAYRLRRIFSGTTLRLAVLVLCFLWTVPTVGLFVSSLRTPNAIRVTGWWTALRNPFNVEQWTLANYQNVVGANGLGDAFVNSLIVTIPATVIPITIAAFAAYAFAWIRFTGRDALFAVVVGLIVVPLQMTLIPILRLYTSTDVNGTFFGIWLAHTGFGIPLAVFLLYNFISQIPRDLIEAAAIDGASHFQIFTMLVLYVSMPAIASFAVFQFIWVWNDLLIALVFLGTGPAVATMTARLSELVGSRGQDWHLLTAGAFLSVCVPLAVFFTLQRYFVRGILAGSIKG
jgi:alpha-glucoside transport system permease protein